MRTLVLLLCARLAMGCGRHLAPKIVTITGAATFVGGVALAGSDGDLFPSQSNDKSGPGVGLMGVGLFVTLIGLVMLAADSSASAPSTTPK